VVVRIGFAWVRTISLISSSAASSSALPIKTSVPFTTRGYGFTAVRAMQISATFPSAMSTRTAQPASGKSIDPRIRDFSYAEADPAAGFGRKTETSSSSVSSAR